MFGLFKKKSEKDKLSEQYRRLMEKAHKVSHSDRTQADKIVTEAEEIAKRIEKLDE